MATEDLTGYLDAMKPAGTEGGELTQLQLLAELQAKAERKVKTLEAELEAAKSELADLAEKQVPDLMEAIGVKEFKTLSGLFISIKETIRASIPTALRPQAFAWLRNNGHAALIQRVVSLSFGRGEDEVANSCLQDMQAKGLEPEDKTSVNSNTLAAFVREQLRNGKEVPQDLLGVHRQRVARIEV